MDKTISYRPGQMADSYAIFCVFEETLADLMQRFGRTPAAAWDDPARLADMWQRRQSLYHHLAQTAAQFWVAEQNGRLLGFARSIIRGPVQQLTEFFIRPDVQSAGVGRELLARAFPDEGLPFRSIIATMDTRAQARYLKLGLYPHFPLYYFWRVPEARPLASDLTIAPLTHTAETLATLAEIDTAVIGFRRDVDHSWLMADRAGFLVQRHGRAVGYGYVSQGGGAGPFALLHAADFPAVLAHAETAAAQAGRAHFGVEVPMCNQTAVRYLLQNGFQIDSFMALCMYNQPLGRLDQYIVTSPPFFL